MNAAIFRIKKIVFPKLDNSNSLDSSEDEGDGKSLLLRLGLSERRNCFDGEILESKS